MNQQKNMISMKSMRNVNSNIMKSIKNMKSMSQVWAELYTWHHIKYMQMTLGHDKILNTQRNLKKNFVLFGKLRIFFLGQLLGEKILSKLLSDC